MSVKSNQKNISIDLETNSFTIITYAGKAKSLAMQAISIAKEGQGYQLPFSVLFMHAEDQLNSSQMIIEISKEFINLYKFIEFKNN
ncbi:PTS lactose/cellobiose transporter subunit IIA [Spiroplasma endosymbiont of Polydrusus pterygomalis]|uniref:PTS lactose/cellobiose transporter subunit IIA n=1 Tax=Spiroplasma endosymbiont of Polydrusus pterygomalis TaxID=3139327 RepID=UPI003CCADE0F